MSNFISEVRSGVSSEAVLQCGDNETVLAKKRPIPGPPDMVLTVMSTIGSAPLSLLSRVSRSTVTCEP